MKALTLWQPWASLLVLPLPQEERPKIHETRPRAFNHTGPLAIHAAQAEPAWVRQMWKVDSELRDVLFRFLFQDHSGRPFRFDEVWASLPRGAVVGRVEQLGCVPAELAESNRLDLLLGDFGPGRWAYPTRNPHRLVVPVPWKGKQGVWTMPNEALIGEWEAA